MNILSFSEFNSQLQKSPFRYIAARRDFDDSDLNKKELFLPAWSRALALMSKLVCKHLASEGCLVAITCCGIWPTEETPKLTEALMRRLGSPFPFTTPTFFSFQPEESAEVEALVRLALISGWDFHVISKKAQCAMFFSHDEWFKISSPNPEVVDKLTGVAILGPQCYVLEPDHSALFKELE